MKRIIKGLIGAIVASAAFFMTVSYADASTGAYIGKEASTEGTTVISRSADFAPGAFSRIYVVERDENNEEAIEESGGFKYKLPTVTYKYQIIETMSGSGSYKTTDEATNEYGLTVSATVSADINDAAYYADCHVERGIGEESISRILCASCTSAREAVELLADIIDEYGSNASNIVMIADQKEAWYMELYTGHQYAAVKMPEDKVAVFGNEFMLETIDADSEDVICSEGLFTLPEDKGFAIYDNDGNLDLYRTYSGDETVNDNNRMRTWIGHMLLAPESVEDYDKSVKYPLFYEAEDKVSVEDVFSIYRNRYEDTKYESDFNEENTYPIGTQNTGEVHVVQIYDDVAPEMSSVIWTNLSSPVYSPFVPVSSLINQIPDSYALIPTVEDGYTDGIASYSFERLNKMCALNRAKYGINVRAFWEGMEKLYCNEVDTYMRNEWEEVYEEDPEEATENIEGYCSSVLEESLANSEKLFNDLMWNLINTDAAGNAFISDKADPSTYYVNENSCYKYMFDVEEYATRMGWEVSYDSDAFVAKKNGKTITITEEEDYGVFNLSDEAGEEADIFNEVETISENSVGNISDYLEEEIESIPDEGWTKEEAIVALDEITEEITEIITDSIVDSIINEKDGVEVDADRLEDTISVVSNEATELLEQYFGVNIEEVIALISEDGVTKEEASELLEGIKDDISSLLEDYFKLKFDGVINEELSEEELLALVDETQSEVIRVIEDYTGEDLSNVSVDVDVEIDTDYIVNFVESLNDESKAALGKLFNVDVNAVIDDYMGSDRASKEEINDSTVDVTVDEKTVSENSVPVEADNEDEKAEEACEDTISENATLDNKDLSNTVSENNVEKNTEDEGINAVSENIVEENAEAEDINAVSENTVAEASEVTNIDAKTATESTVEEVVSDQTTEFTESVASSENTVEEKTNEEETIYITVHRVKNRLYATSAIMKYFE